jgi:aminoglycoside phosphotransferase (APT) family kinase protein
VLRFLADHPPSRSHAWRVPRVVGAGTDRGIIPYDYLLLEYVPDRPGEPVFRQAGETHRASLSRQLGEVLADLHALDVPGTRYGKWDRATASLGAADDWRDYMAEQVEAALAEAARLRVLSPRWVQVTREWLAAHLQVVPRRPPRHLLHYDLSFSNVLVDAHNRITTVLDFEWSGIGPPVSELGAMDADDGFVEDAFWDGYLRGRGLDRAMLQEAHYYRVCGELSFLSVAAIHWQGHGNPARRQRLARLIAGEPTPFLARFGRPF